MSEPLQPALAQLGYLLQSFCRQTVVPKPSVARQMTLKAVETSVTALAQLGYLRSFFQGQRTARMTL